MEQINLLHNILKQNEAIYSVIHKAQKLSIPDYYIAAGCIAQTVWNYQNGFDLTFGISDIDFVYFDNKDLSAESEKKTAVKIQSIFNDLPLKLDVVNEARVYLWYKDLFGYDIKPYSSLKSAINTFLTTATSIGVRFINDCFQVYSPFGSDDLLNMTVRANKTQITKEIFECKVEKWKAKWQNIKVIEW